MLGLLRCNVSLMTDFFILKLFLSFFAGSLWITAGTVLAERYGTKIGGLIAGVPSTILLSFFFIAWTQSADIAVEATSIVPLIGGITCLFVVAYIVLLKVNFWVALAGALFVWSSLSYTVVFLKFNNFAVSLLMYVLLLFLSYCFVDKVLKVRSEPGKELRFTFAAMLFRALFSGGVIALAVVMTKIGGPLLGGMFSMFPAMFIGILFITYFSNGPSFSAAVMKAAMPGAISVVVYGLSVRYTYLTLGLLWGTLVSFLASLASSFLIHYFMKRRSLQNQDSALHRKAES